MKKQFLAAAALVLVTSGAGMALPVSVHTAVGDSIGEKVLKTQSNLEVEQPLETGGVSPVPLPAAGWMLLAGIGGIVALRRRAKA